MRSRLCFTVALCLLLPAAPGIAAEPSLEEQLERAGALLRTRPREALAAFSKIERSHPNCLECQLGIASAHNELRNYLDAEKAARRVLEANNADPALQLAAWTVIGVSFYNRTPLDASAGLLTTNMKEAEAAFRRAHDADGGKTESVRWNLASAVEWLGAEDEANALWSDPEMVADARARERGEPVERDVKTRAALLSGQAQRPVRVSDAELEYSDRARYQRIEGLVVLETIIDTDGVVESVRVMRGLRGCTMQAIRSIRQWKFKPAMLDGKPIKVYYTVTVKFALQR